jgi:hypothetical protein
LVASKTVGVMGFGVFTDNWVRVGLTTKVAVFSSKVTVAFGLSGRLISGPLEQEVIVMRAIT